MPNVILRLPAVVVVGALLAAACGGSPPPTGDGGASSTDGVSAAAAEAVPAEALRLGEPVTLRLEVDGELRAAVEGLGGDAGPATTIRLTLADLAGPDAAVNLRVFVNTPEADAETPLDRPGYVADVGFFPAAGDPAADTFLLDLAPVLAALPAASRLADGRFVDVTLIALAADDGPTTESLEPRRLELGAVRLSLPPSGGEDD